MSQLYFRYSDIYEYMLANTAGENFSWEKVKEGHVFVDKYIDYWSKYNDTIFNFYSSIGLVVPDFWVTYFIFPRKGMTPFSDPLTLFIKEDLDEVTATLVHEFVHVLLSFGPNSELEQKIWAHITKTFPNNSVETNIELMTIMIAKEGLKKIFGEEKAKKYLDLEKSYSTLKPAWDIIDSQSEIIKEQDPIKAIFNLK